MRACAVVSRSLSVARRPCERLAGELAKPSRVHARLGASVCSVGVILCQYLYPFNACPGAAGGRARGGARLGAAHPPALVADERGQQEGATSEGEGRRHLANDDEDPHCATREEWLGTESTAVRGTRSSPGPSIFSRSRASATSGAVKCLGARIKVSTLQEVMQAESRTNVGQNRGAGVPKPPGCAAATGSATSAASTPPRLAESTNGVRGDFRAP